jgi:uncharacterized protein YaeQ
VSAKYSFQLQSTDPRRPLPHKIIIGQAPPETGIDVVLKLLAYLLFFRERIQLDVRLHEQDIQLVPDLVQLDYALRPALWIECGDCSAARLDRLAVKVPEAEIWVVQRSATGINQLHEGMRKAGLRRGRYHLAGLDEPMVDEVLALLQSRNQVLWVRGDFDPPNLQFDFNGLWFDAPFRVWTF